VWYDWLYSKWQDDPTGQEKYETLGYYQQPSGFSPLAENIANLPGQRGYYTNLAKGKKEEWIKQFIEVQWGYSLKGKPVYRSFNPVIHVSSRPLIYNPHLPLVMGFDAGLTPAGVFGQMSPHGQLMVLAELTSSSMGAKRFCNELAKPILAMRFPNPALLIAADPATNQRSQTDEVTVKRILEEEMGVKVHAQGTNALAARLDAVDHFLTRLTDNGPALIIDPDCVTLIRGFKSGYRYPVSNKGQIGDSPEKNDYSHVHDAMQYLCQEFMGGEIRDARRRKAAQIGFGQRVQNPYNVR
jgi:hypothetical protein